MLEHDSGVQGQSVGKSGEPIKLTLQPGEGVAVTVWADGTVLTEKIHDPLPPPGSGSVVLDHSNMVELPILPIGRWEAFWFVAKIHIRRILSRLDPRDRRLLQELAGLRLLLAACFPDQKLTDSPPDTIALAKFLLEDYYNLKIAETQRAQVYQSFLQMKNEQDRIAVYLRDLYPGAIARGEHDNKSLADLVIHYLSKS